MMKRNNYPRKGKKKMSQKNAIARDRIPKSLPPVNDQLSVGMKLRFVTTSVFSGTFAVTPYNLLDAWFLAGTATTAYQLFDFVRVKRVTVRAMGIAAGGGGGLPQAPYASVGIEFFGLSTGLVASGKQAEDSGIGYENPAMVSLCPDPLSQVAQFQAATGSSIFGIRAIDQFGSGIVGAIIDVDVVYRNSADVNPAAVAVARAGLTPGALYFGGLDGNPLATTAARSTFQKRA